MAAARGAMAALLAALAVGSLPLVTVAMRTLDRVTPVEKVILLLESIKTEIEVDGHKEAEGYNAFSCFCKDKTKFVSESILATQGKIGTLSATIEDETAQKKNKEAERAEREKEQVELKGALKTTKETCQQEHDMYIANNADLTKAIQSLEDAKQKVEESRFVTPVSTLAMKQTVQRSLEVAEAMKIISDAPKWGAASAFLQSTVDPMDPEYKFHSQPLLDILSQLEDEFKKKKSAADEEWAMTEENCKETTLDLEQKIETNKGAMDRLTTEIDALTSSIASTRESLVEAEYSMKEDQLYMKDLTSMCELRAKDWDQRTQLRAGELQAVSEALDILKVQVTATEVVNKRALLQMQRRKVAAAVSAGAGASAGTLSFLQSIAVESQKTHGAERLLGSDRGGEAAKEQRRKKAVELLRQEGGRLGSVALSSLALRAAEDPFLKVKTIIQKLIERLLAEATSEATKKGFCDKELASNRKDREFRYAEVQTLDAELRILEAKKVELETEIEDLTNAVEDITNALERATEDRKEEKATNLANIATAKDGLKAVTEAMTILKAFYKEAAKATVLAQAKASPVDEDTAGPGFTGAYKGKQEASKGIFGLLEVIQSDFDRTIRVTTQAEEEAAAAFVEMERAAKAAISGKSEKIELDKEDLTTTKNTIARKMKEMQDNMDLVDKALKALDALKPMCIDSGMSYSERVEKRDREMTALRKAFCYLVDDEVVADEDKTLCNQWGHTTS